jgi:hypothetical protein
MIRKKGRTQKCSAAQARRRLGHAREFLSVAELVGDENDLEYGSVAASLAVLAGIASSDAACCKELGERSRSQNHRDAIALLDQITPGGGVAGGHLRGLIDLKDTAHYGLINVSAANLKRALRGASHLLTFAEEVVQR